MLDKILDNYINECTKYGLNPTREGWKFYRLLVENEGEWKECAA